jgi:rhodanese-related sulfurtransferase
MIAGWLILASGCAGTPGSVTTVVFPEDAADSVADRSARLIDVRLPREMTDRRMAVAAHPVPFDPIEPSAFVAAVEQLLAGDRSASTILICEIGVRSLQARRALVEAGFTAVVSVDQGYSGWRAADLPLVRAQP